jgi:outer membrane lipoprotein
MRGQMVASTRSGRDGASLAGGERVRAKLLAAVLIAAMGLGGCATTAAFPPEMLAGVNQTLTLGEIRGAPGAFLQQKVLLGGEIVQTRPRPDETEIEVLGRPLRSDDSPAPIDASDGRFLVVSTQFLDPAIYAPGRRLTVLGTFTGEEERPIGDQPYRYPVVVAEQVRLWPAQPPAYAYPYPYYPYPYYYYPYSYLGPPWWGGAFFGPPWYRYRPFGPYWW